MHETFGKGYDLSNDLLDMEDPPPKSSPEFIDVIHTTPKTIEFISDPQKIKLLLNNELYPIIALLRHGNFTAKEITELYSTYSGSGYKPKSEKTIYRYLKELKEAGLIDEVGQRVIKGQTATEKIWGRTAKVFYIQQEEGEEFVEKLCKEDCVACKDDGLHLQAQKGLGLMTLLKDIYPVEHTKVNFSKFMNSLEKAIMNEFQQQLAKLTENELNQVARLPYNAITNLLTMSGLISLMNKAPEFLDKRIKKYLTS